jgi:hypothetical protein
VTRRKSKKVLPAGKKPVPAAPRDPRQLTPREQVFVAAYCGVAAFNASEAYRLAGYGGNPASVSTHASRLVGFGRVAVAIAARVQARVAELAIMDGDEALQRISRIARGDIRQLLSPDDPLAQLPDTIALCIKSIVPGAYGRRLVLHDSLAAALTMAKIAGRLKEVLRVEHSLEDIMARASEPPADE